MKPLRPATAFIVNPTPAYESIAFTPLNESVTDSTQRSSSASRARRTPRRAAGRCAAGGNQNLDMRQLLYRRDFNGSGPAVRARALSPEPLMASSRSGPQLLSQS